MELLCDEVRAENLDDPKALPQKLVALLGGGFVEADGCVFFAELKQKAGYLKAETFSDRTGYECFVNHVHLEDYLENGNLAALVMLGRGLAFAAQLKDRLATLPGKRHFRVIVSFNGSSCTVRFHAIRADEEWVDKDLDAYKEEAVAVLET
jgi:hypothetical protein